jgi:hypothetical protein
MQIREREAFEIVSRTPIVSGGRSLVPADALDLASVSVDPTTRPLRIVAAAS